ncbi:MAG: hypothetical protein RJA70_4712 [Pseudomonadota bacterium]|jgi:DNA-binding NtrC family response regulator
MRPTILLVDDDSNILDGLNRVLRGERYVTYTAHNVDEAIAVLGRHRVDVIVSDEQMPGAVGSELLTFARQRYPDTIRIMLTGKANVQSALRAVESGRVFRFLDKPCSSDKVLGTIREALLKRSVLTARHGHGGQLSMSQAEATKVFERVATQDVKRRQGGD